MRKVGIVIGTIVLVLIVAVMVFAATFNVNQYRGTIQSELEKRLDRRVALGDMHLGIFPPRLQVQNLSIADDPKFNDAPKANINPAVCGWKLIATVDTRSNDEDKDGGQFGVSITSQSGNLGKFRYLLFDLYVTEIADDFGNTFYSEIDVVANHGPK